LLDEFISTIGPADEDSESLIGHPRKPGFVAKIGLSNPCVGFLFRCYLDPKYDRLARSLRDLLDLVAEIEAAGAGFRSLAEEIDTTTPAGRLIFHVFASIAQFERERIVERTREGLAAARARGRVGGRPPARGPDQRAEARRMRDEDGRSLAEIARLFRVSPQTVRRL
jgi:DNA invertase Pin-like site-specific DNA recombinase